MKKLSMMGCLWILFCVGILLLINAVQKFFRFLWKPFSASKKEETTSKRRAPRKGEWVKTSPERKKIISEDEGEYIDYTEVDE